MASTTASAAAAPGCQPNAVRCQRGSPQRCHNGSWQNTEPCAQARYCHAGACVAAVAVSPTGRYALLQSGGVLTWSTSEGVPREGSAHAVEGIENATSFVSPHCVDTAPGTGTERKAAIERKVAPESKVADADRSPAKDITPWRPDRVKCIEDDKLSADRKPPWEHPKMPAGMDGALRYAGTRHYGCAVMPDRRVMCWGSNRDGGVGIGVVDDSSAPGRPPSHVIGLNGVDKVVTGIMHACALRNNGRVVCWGSDECGNLGGPGVRATIGRAKPGRPLIIQDKVVDIVVADMAGRGLARTAKGQVYRWGRDCAGIRQVYTRANPPRVVPELQGARSLGIGSYGGAAITKDGRLIQWVGDDEGRVIKQYDIMGSLG